MLLNSGYHDVVNAFNVTTWIFKNMYGVFWKTQAQSVLKKELLKQNIINITGVIMSMFTRDVIYILKEICPLNCGFFSSSGQHQGY